MNQEEAMSTEALNRIAAAIEDSTAANREWFAANKAVLDARVECDLAMAEFYRHQIDGLRRKAITDADDAEARALVIDALTLRRDRLRDEATR